MLRQAAKTQVAHHLARAVRMLVRVGGVEHPRRRAGLRQAPEEELPPPVQGMDRLALVAAAHQLAQVVQPRVQGAGEQLLLPAVHPPAPVAAAHQLAQVAQPRARGAVEQLLLPAVRRPAPVAAAHQLAQVAPVHPQVVAEHLQAKADT